MPDPLSCSQIGYRPTSGMHVTTDIDEEHWHQMSDPGSYEWWYFDAEDSASGISCVVIWFSGFPFSPCYTDRYERWKLNGKSDPPPHPSDYCAFSFQLYQHDRELVNFIKEGEKDLFISNASSIGVSFENNSFRYDAATNEYRLDIDFAFPLRQKQVRASLSFSSCQRINHHHLQTARPAPAQHQWLLSVPKATVTGVIEIGQPGAEKKRRFSIDGKGYHDHNLGTIPMQESIARWHWGRAFSDGMDLIFYVIFFRNNAEQPFTLLILHDTVKDQVAIHQSLGFSERSTWRGIFSPLHSRKLEFSNQHCQLSVLHHKVLDSGPFYLRFSSKIKLVIDGEEPRNIIGISEFLNPVRLQSRFMRFFTRSRIWRNREQSIMYKSYNSFKNCLEWKFG